VHTPSVLKYNLIALTSALYASPPSPPPGGAGPVFEIPKTLPSELCVLRWGNNPSRHGNVACNNRTLQLLPGVQAAERFDTVTIDFNHGLLDPAIPEPKPRAAVGVPEVRPGDGLYLTRLTWTPEGEAAYLGGLYEDLSPTVSRLADGTVFFLHSVALCRQGELSGHYAYTRFSTGFITVGIHTMKPEEYQAALVALLKDRGIVFDPETAKAEDLAAALTALTAAENKPAENKPAENKPAETVALSAAEVNVLIAKALEKASQSNGAATKLTAAKLAGKVVPLSAASFAVLSGAEQDAVLAAIPVTVPIESVVEGFSASIGETTAFATISAITGITDADRKEYAKPIIKRSK
jgi:hypothetical protein